MERYQSNSPTIEQFNSWTLEDKTCFIERNFNRLAFTDQRDEIITGIPRFIKTPDHVIIKYVFNKDKELIYATAMDLEKAAHALENLVTGLDAVVKKNMN